MERPDQAGVGIDEMQFGFMPECCTHRRSAWLQTRRGGGGDERVLMKPPLIGGVLGIFLKSLSLRMHFKPF